MTGDTTAADERACVLIVEGRFYADIADELARGAIADLDVHGFVTERIGVPGAFEIPAALARAAKAVQGDDSPRYAGFVALGCVIRGETDHYDHICRETGRALMELAVSGGLALGNGVLTVENRSQAWERARVANGRDKGGDAARACRAMIEIGRRFAAPGFAVPDGRS